MHAGGCEHRRSAAGVAPWDELFQAWRDGKMRRQDLPEKVVAMTLDLCERWRAEQERCARVHAAQRLSRDPGPSRSRSRSRSPNSLCRSSVSGCAEGIYFIIVTHR